MHRKLTLRYIIYYYLRQLLLLLLLLFSLCLFNFINFISSFYYLFLLSIFSSSSLIWTIGLIQIND